MYGDRIMEWIASGRDIILNIFNKDNACRALIIVKGDILVEEKMFTQKKISSMLRNNILTLILLTLLIMFLSLFLVQRTTKNNARPAT
jgi:hypothetical protein